MHSEILLSLLAGILTALSPCVLPALPLIVGSACQQHRLGPLAVALGMALSFATLGLLLFSSGDILGIDARAMRNLAAVLMVLAGLVLLIPKLQTLFGKLANPLAAKAEKFLQIQGGAGLSGQFIVGALLGLVWSPCSGPTLGAAVALAGTQGFTLFGALILFVFGLGASLPLLIIAYGSRRLFLSARGGMMRFANLGKRVFGAILVLIGLLILSKLDKSFEAAMLNTLPDWLNELTTRY